MKQKVMHISSMGLNIAITVLSFVAWILMFASSGNGTYEAGGFSSLLFFTVLSNLFVGITSLLLFVFQLISFVKKENHVKEWVMVLKFVSVVSVVLTALTVACFLAPRALMNQEGYFSLYASQNLFFHFIIPLLALINFIFFENEPSLKFRYTFFSLLPVIFYGLFYLFNYEYKFVGIKKADSSIEYDWYGMIKNDKTWFILLVVGILLLATFLLSLLLYFLNHFFQHVLRGYDDDEGVEIYSTSLSQSENPHVTQVEETILDDKIIAHVDNGHIPEGKDVQEINVDGDTREVRETFSSETGTIHVVTKQVKKKARKTSTMNLAATRPNNKYKNGARVYHISRHALSGTWQVRLANGEKAIKTFFTQQEAIDYAKALVKTQGGSIRVHSKKGSIRKD